MTTRESIPVVRRSRTRYDERIPLDDDDYRHRSAPRDSSIVPHAVASLKPDLMTDYVCRIRDDVLDRAVETLVEYLRGRTFLLGRLRYL